ncbi:hypothetical protein B0H66DRAFT_106284 [Apodospora peruviana]|uniref:Uncharacterized protein n=1 Tax=Apodospora peruviana TaxID=516989 RepID=A0AAE0IIC4_9PEZI|nr:hypothetical protein B0H66DRAFT_106284 [Apodospora peruviana]
MSAKVYTTIEELDDLEEDALDCTISQRLEALQIVAAVFDLNGLDYGLIGGTNFFLRGSDRTTTDVDIAVTGRTSMAEVLEMLDHDPRITRPASDRPMLWVSGVARVFVLIDDTQNVQIDLKRQNTSHDFDAETELLPVDGSGEARVRFFKVGPLVKMKLRAHYIRESNDDYHDLRFACLDRRYGPLVKAASQEYPYDDRALFLDKVLENHPADEYLIRDVMNLVARSGEGSEESAGSEGHDERGGFYVASGSGRARVGRSSSAESLT